MSALSSRTRYVRGLCGRNRLSPPIGCHRRVNRNPHRGRVNRNPHHGTFPSHKSSVPLLMEPCRINWESSLRASSTMSACAAAATLLRGGRRRMPANGRIAS
eukprot:898493-Prorocentrum_minimum.AAC.1